MFIALTLLLLAQRAAPPDCVTIGTPDPKKVFVYQRQGDGAQAHQYSQQWEDVTPTGSRVRVTRATNVIVQTNQHRVVDDVSVIDSSASTSRSLRDKTTFRPGVIGDPIFKACAGRTWTIPVSTASHESTQGATHTVPSYAGTLRIVAIRESVTVPAGRFDTVRFIRSLNAEGHQTVDEYWKSIEHGVIVKHVSTLPGGASTEMLIAIR